MHVMECGGNENLPEFQAFRQQESTLGVKCFLNFLIVETEPES